MLSSKGQISSIIHHHASSMRYLKKMIVEFWTGGFDI